MGDREISDVDTSDGNDQDPYDHDIDDLDSADRDNNDPIDGQGPQNRTDEVLLTEPSATETAASKKAALVQTTVDAEVSQRSSRHPVPELPATQHSTNVSEQESLSETESLPGPESTGDAEVELTINDLIDEYSKFLLSYGYRLAGSASDAEDLAQQTFLIAYQKLNQLRSPAAAKAWLCAILRSCWLKSIRRNSPVPASNFEFELGEMLVDEETEVEFDSQAVKLALTELPPDYRLVLLMYYFEELSYQEIADKLRVKIGTVMSRLSRAKERVRRRLGSKDQLLDQ